MTVPHYRMYVDGTWRDAPTALEVRAPATNELIATVGDQLASYKRPRAIVFVDEIPRLASGKVLRRVLKNDYIQPG